MAICTDSVHVHSVNSSISWKDGGAVLLACSDIGLHKHITRQHVDDKVIRDGRKFFRWLFQSWKKKVHLSLIYWNLAFISFKSFSYKVWKDIQQENGWRRDLAIEYGFLSPCWSLILNQFCSLPSAPWFTLNEFCLVSSILNCTNISSHDKYMIAVTDMLPGSLHRLPWDSIALEQLRLA